MSDRDRKAERGPSGKLRFESAARDGATSGHIGPKSKPHQRFDGEDSRQPDRNGAQSHEPQGRSPTPQNDNPVETPAMPDAPREPLTSGHNGPKLDFTPEHKPKKKAAGQPLRFEDGAGADTPPPVEDGTSGQCGPKSKNSKFKRESEQARPSERLRHDGDETPPGDGGHASSGKTGDAPGGEKAARDSKRMNKSKFRVEKSGAKLDKAREKLAAQKPPKKPGVGKTIGRAAGRSVHGYVHKKIREIERENVGTEAAHKTELAGESLVRGTSRFIKRRNRTRPARRVRKWENKNIKARADYEFRKLTLEHPELNKNALSRYLQKRKIKKQYQKQAWEAAKQSAQAAKKAAVTTGKIAGAVWRFVRGNPKIILIVAILFLLIVILQSCMGALTTIGNGITGAVGGTSYVSSDSDIETVERSYTALETALREKLARIESDYPSYDEYRYSVDEIGHDPFELASYLTAKYDDYTPNRVQAELQSLIEQQYTLTITETVEVRYRTETRTDTWTDSEGNSHSDTYTVEVPYNYYILNVSLRNHSLEAVALQNLDPEQTQRYIVYQKTKGNRPYLFAGNPSVNHGEYTDYDIPPEALNDPDFAALIAEAEKYLGYPYVWGGSSPSTSFDCSGFVCWVLDKSGVYPMSRTTAQGIFNQCAKIPPSEARPGDIIFFTGTYDSPGPVSHVGIYVGNGMMIHCGNPISYTSIETSYWQSHFYSYGRVN